MCRPKYGLPVVLARSAPAGWRACSHLLPVAGRPGTLARQPQAGFRAGRVAGIWWRKRPPNAAPVLACACWCRHFALPSEDQIQDTRTYLFFVFILVPIPILVSILTNQGCAQRRQAQSLSGPLEVDLTTATSLERDTFAPLLFAYQSEFIVNSDRFAAKVRDSAPGDGEMK